MQKILQSLAGPAKEELRVQAFQVPGHSISIPQRSSTRRDRQTLAAARRRSRLEYSYVRDLGGCMLSRFDSSQHSGLIFEAQAGASRELASRWRPVREGAGADALAAGLAAGLAGVGAAAFLAAGFAAALDAAGAGVAAQHGHSITPRQSSLQMCSSQMPHTTPCDSGSSATKGVSSCRAAEQTLSSSSSSSSSSSEAIANVKSGLVLEISS